MQLYDFIADQTLNTSEFQTSLPLSCNISSEGYFVVCANETIICDAKNNDHIVYDYNEYTVSQFDVTSDQVVLLFDTPGFEIFYQIVSLSANGIENYTSSVYQTIYDLEICGEFVCLLCEGEILVCNGQSINVIDAKEATGGCKLLANINNTVYLCTDSSAPLIKLGE